MNKTIKISNLISGLVLVSCCDIAYINYLNSSISLGLLFLRLTLILLIGIIVIANSKSKRTNKIFIAVNFLFILFYVVSLYRSIDMFYYITKILSKPYLILLYMQYVISKEQKIDDTLNVWKKILILLCTIDFITILAYPNGMYKENSYSINWFLGYKTARMVYSWALLFIVSYLEMDKKRTKKIKLSTSTLYCFIICILGAFYSQATGASTALALYGILIYILKLEKNDNRKFYKLFNHKKLLLGSAIIYYVIITIESNVYIQNIITNIFNKSATLSNRTDIWKNCIDFYSKSPIIGKGIYTPQEYISITKYFLGTNAHNYFLTLLISGGVVSILIYIYIFKTSMQRETKMYTKKELTLIFSIVVFLLIGLTSSALAFSTFAFLPFILLEYEKSNNRKDDTNEKSINEK